MNTPARLCLPLPQWQPLQFRIVFAYDHEVDPRTCRIAGFRSPNYALWLLRRGEVALDMGEWRQTVREGSWVLLPPRVTRSHHFTPGAAILSLHFHVAWPGDRELFVLPQPLVRPRAAWHELEERLGAMLAPGVTPWQEPLDLAAYARLSSQRLLWLAAWCEHMRREGLSERGPHDLDPRLEAAVRELAAGTYLAAVPYPRLCRVSGLGRVQLDRLFAAQLGQTPKRFLEARCLRRVTELLETTRMPVKEICYATGFANPAHFSTWFRRHVGRSPESYRDSLG